MNKEQPVLRPEELARKASQARSQSHELQTRTVQTARRVAATEQVVADTLANLATQHPGHAGFLRSISQAARQQAARQHEWADRHERLHAAGRSDVA